jgi:hypothetical protein
VDDIDFSIVVNKHGWTTFLFYLEGKIHKINISSVLSDPLCEFANLLLSLLNNESEVILRWYNEPGWRIIRTIRDSQERHILLIEIGYGADLEPNEYKKEFEFKIKQKQFIIIGIYQLKKIYHLLQEKSFAKERKEEFPYELYQKLLIKAAQVIPEIL